MSTIIVCDGGCGRQSPDPKTRLHVANNWLRARVGSRHHEASEYQFCDACAPRVLEALQPVAALSEKP